ncbi:MAG: septal ring lytic transglycosylase RlpA family protein [Verrucomicrobiae bacterium]|nr:septal ring lytic transglycosylase RlpA family protein [Verrucomicrobiae bacterium]
MKLSGTRKSSSYYEPKLARNEPAGTGQTSRGVGSFYRVRTNGTRTASGIPLRDSVPTAAHRSLPFGTLVRVTNLKNGRSEIVKITDRGPFVRGRIIDVSLAAAEELQMINSGIVPVEIEVMRPPNSI